MSAGAQPRRGGRARTKRSFGADFTPEGRKTEAAQASPAGPGIAARLQPKSCTAHAACASAWVTEPEIQLCCIAVGHGQGLGWLLARVRLTCGGATRRRASAGAPLTRHKFSVWG